MNSCRISILVTIEGEHQQETKGIIERMCGIAGQFGGTVDPRNLKRMGMQMAARGPDSSDEWFDHGASIGFAHRRLAIVDVSPSGNQPMHSYSGRYVICLNGEVYNHVELRRVIECDHQAYAYEWRGHSDVETLLALIEAVGLEKALKQIRGMFALALWDRKEKKLSLARDRMGEKPLYYGWIGTKFLFASDLAAITANPGFSPDLSTEAITVYQKRNYIPAPLSIYKGIFKLPPATILEMAYGDAVAKRDQPYSAFNAPASGMFKTYWSLSDAVCSGLERPFASDREALDTLDKQLAETLKMQVRADVPVGAFLSGGIDSSLIVALMNHHVGVQPKTFTIGFEESIHDEGQYAKPVAKHLNTDHHELYVTPRDVIDVIPKLPTIYTEPFADSSQIPTFLVSQLARQQVTVALSGDAGDEIFGGYNRHLWTSDIWPKFSKLPFSMRSLLGRILLLPPIEFWNRLSPTPGPWQVPVLGDKIQKISRILRTARDTQSLYLGLLDEWDGQTETLLGEYLPPLPAQSGLSDTAKLMYWDALTYLPDDILCKVDRAAMGVSLETRAPYLDHNVIETAMRLPSHMRIRNGSTKWALRQLLYRHVPKELIERPKAGFGIPIGEWIKGPLRDWAEALLDEKQLAASGVVDFRAVRQRWQEHLAGRRDWTSSLWGTLMLQAFLLHQREKPFVEV